MAHPVRPDIFERFAKRVCITDSCWIWEGTKSRAGYGRFNFRGVTRIAHRVGYELFKGIIPPSLTIDHLCRTHPCVNPNHLEAVTQKENVWRGRLKDIFGWGRCTHGFSRKRDCRICRRAYRKPKGIPA